MASVRPLLYTYRRCPYAMRARMALRIARVAYDAHEIVLRDKPASMLAASPKGTVPVLVLPTGQVIEQSWDIVKWALTAENACEEVQAYWHRAQTADNLDLLRINDSDFKFHLDRYKYPERYKDEMDAGDAAVQRITHRDQAVAGLLTRLDRRLSEHPYLGGDLACATDFGIFPFVRQFAAVEPAWFDALPLAHLKTWLRDWLNSSLFEACMQKFPAHAVTQPAD